MLLGLLIAAACSARASIFYDEQARGIRVVDFPPEMPCTLERLLQMDRLYGWGMITYDGEQDAYTITGDLWIGSNDGTDTFLQIGSREHPRETLVMAGNVVVCPYWIEGVNREEHYWTGPQAANRLTIGVPGDENVTAALRFLDPEHVGHSLRLGAMPLPDGSLQSGRGGQLRVHHSAITSVTPEPGSEMGFATTLGGMDLRGDSVILDHATISWVKGAATYGMSDNGSVRDTLFDHLGTAIINGRQDLSGCTFSNCEVAIRDYGSLDAVLTDCTFRDNDRNWTLSYSNRGLVCIDCTWTEPRKGDLYQAWQNKQTGQMQYPSFVSKRHVIVEVVDEAGKPVAGARVRVRCEQETPEIVENATQQTGPAGRTPGRGEDGAILLVQTVRQATDVPNQPAVTELSYTIEASAEGFAEAKVEHLRPVESWQSVRIVLHKQQ